MRTLILASLLALPTAAGEKFRMGEGTIVEFDDWNIPIEVDSEWLNFPEEPQAIQFVNESEFIVRFSPDGKITWNPKFTADEAGKKFAESVAKWWPEACGESKGRKG